MQQNSSGLSGRSISNRNTATSGDTNKDATFDRSDRTGVGQQNDMASKATSSDMFGSSNKKDAFVGKSDRSDLNISDRDRSDQKAGDLGQGGFSDRGQQQRKI